MKHGPCGTYGSLPIRTLGEKHNHSSPLLSTASVMGFPQASCSPQGSLALLFMSKGMDARCARGSRLPEGGRQGLGFKPSPQLGNPREVCSRQEGRVLGGRGGTHIF